MIHESGSVEGAGGVHLFTQCWLPEEPTVATVVMVHGLGEHSSRYAHVAMALVADGYAVHTLDHRGHGQSEGMRVQIGSFSEYTADLDLLVAQVEQRHPGVPRFMLGHSMGGLVALNYVLDHPHRLDALVVSGTPAAVPKSISKTTVRAGRVLARLAPNAGVTALPLKQVSRDPKVVAAYFADPLINRHKIRARLGAAMLDAMARVERAAPELTLPMLILHGGDDVLAEASASRQLAEHVGSPDATLIIYDHLFHEIFNEPERERVIADVRSFLKRQLIAAGAAAVGTGGDAVQAPGSV